MAKVLILAEGQTEEFFVTRLLAPYLAVRNVFPKVTVVPTKKVPDGPDFKGGTISYSKTKLLLRKLLNDTSAALVTTLFDFYGLRDDFPKPKRGSCYEKVAELERLIGQEFDNNPRLLPYFCLYEFEAMLFVKPDELAAVLGRDHLSARFQAIKSLFPSPEEINDDPETAPSKRIIELVPDYRKIAHGISALEKITIDAVRSECLHFNEWLTKLEELGHTSS